MLVLYFIIWCVVFCINSYLTVLLYRTLLVQKAETKKILMFYLLLNFIHIGLTDYVIQSYLIKFISMCLVYASTVIFMFEGSLLKKFIVYIENFILILLQEIIMTQIWFGILDMNWKEVGGYSLQRIQMNIGCTIIAIIIYPVFIYIQNKIQFVISTKKLQYIIICFISQMTTSVIYEFIMIEIGLNSVIIFYAFVIYLVISFLIDIFLLNVLSQMEIKEITEQNIEQSMKQDEIVTEYYSEIVANINSLVKLKESYSNELNEIYRISDLKYDNSVYMSTNQYIYDNILVSNILYNVKRQLDKLSCKYQLDFDIPKNINIESIDLSSLLINVFDNAIEALNIYKLKFNNDKCNMHLKAYGKIENDKLIISVENVKSPSQKTRETDNIYVSSKDNKELHGYGMQILQKIVDKYNGKMKIEYTDTRFLNRIELNI